MKQIKSLVFASVLAALCCVATLVITIPSPSGGFMNLGDTVVLLSAYLLGPGWGAAAAGIGSALADLLAGALLYRALGRRGLLACGLLAESIMVLGYWCYDGLLMGSLAGAAVGIPSNLMQAAFGLAASTALTLALKKSAYVRELFPDF